MMNCKDISELSPLYLSRELDAARTAEFRGHLASCPSCANECEHLAELDARMREETAAEYVDTTALDQRVRESIARPVRRWMIPAGIAAVLVAGFFAYRVWLTPDRACTEAALDHQREVVEGARRTWRSDPGAISELADRQGVSLAQFSPPGYRLERGKLCRLNGKVFLHLVYGSADGEVSLFLKPRDGTRSSIRTTESGLEHIASFDSNRATAIAVATQSKNAAVQLAQFASVIL